MSGKFVNFPCLSPLFGVGLAYVDVYAKFRFVSLITPRMVQKTTL